MATRRDRGEGSLYWHEGRQRWLVAVEVGFAADGKRRRRVVSGRTKTEAKDKLLLLRRDQADGLPVERQGYSVADAVESWLRFGLVGREASTRSKYRFLADRQLLPMLGRRRLADLYAEQVDAWLADRAKVVSTATLSILLSMLRRAIRRAQSRDLVRRNVALLCEVPRGRGGRQSKSLTLAQAHSLLAAADGTPMAAYVVVSLLTGARTEELRALTWSHLDVDSRPACMQLWRSVRRGGETKTASSRRTLELPDRCVRALHEHRIAQDRVRVTAGERWHSLDLVFCTRFGTPLDAANVRRAFRSVVAAAGLEAEQWTPRELRHSFVSLLSSSGMPIEDIAHLVGHASTSVTEKVYRKELRPVLRAGATTMNTLFDGLSE